MVGLGVEGGVLYFATLEVCPDVEGAGLGICDVAPDFETELQGETGKDGECGGGHLGYKAVWPVRRWLMMMVESEVDVGMEMMWTWQGMWGARRYQSGERSLRNGLSTLASQSQGL